MVKLKITELKKELKQMENKELIGVISELYKKIPDVQHYLSTRFIGEDAVQSLYESAKKKIKDEFFPDRGFGKNGVGWGYHDELCDIYFSMGWDEEE